MKKILLITSPRDARWLESDSEVAKGLIDFSMAVSDASTMMKVTSVDRLEFIVSNTKTLIWDNYNECDIADYDVVHMRNIDKSVNLFDYAKAVTSYVLHHGRQIIEAEDQGFALGKLSQMTIFSQAKLPIPMTIASWDNATLLRLAVEHLDFPIILKANNGMKGSDNYLIDDRNQLEDTLKDSTLQYVAQQFIPNDGDYRVLIAGHDVDPLIFKRMNIGDSHLNNTSQGAEAKRYDKGEVDEQVINYALAAAKVVKRQFTGIDIMQNKKDGSWVLLEANINPALSMGAYKQEKVALYKTMLRTVMEV